MVPAGSLPVDSCEPLVFLDPEEATKAHSLTAIVHCLRPSCFTLLTFTPRPCSPFASSLTAPLPLYFILYTLYFISHCATSLQELARLQGECSSEAEAMALEQPAAARWQAAMQAPLTTPTIFCALTARHKSRNLHHLLRVGHWSS